MKKQHFLITIFLLLPTLAWSQAQEIEPTRNLFKTEIGLHGLGVSYDFKLNQKATVDIATGLGGGYQIYANSYEYTWNLLSPTWFVRAHFKRYYNREKRYSKGKRIHNNSGNFFGAIFKYNTEELGNHNLGDFLFNNPGHEALNLNIHWGMQRALGKRFLFNQMIGIAYTKDMLTERSAILPAYNLKFSYIIGLKK